MPTYAYFQSHTEKSIDLAALKSRCAGHHVYAKNYFVDESRDRKHFEELLAKLRLGDTVVIIRECQMAF